MADKARQGPEPGVLGKPQKTIGFAFEDLTEYKEMVDSGLIELSFAEFVRQALKHELARYRAEGKQKKGGRKV